MRLQRLAGLGIAVGFLACSDAPITSGPTDPSFDISDGAHQGNQNFFFLPPMVFNPNPTGTFDASLSPEVEICVWDGTVCGGVPAAFGATTQLRQAPNAFAASVGLPFLRGKGGTNEWGGLTDVRANRATRFRNPEWLQLAWVTFVRRLYQSLSPPRTSS